MSAATHSLRTWPPFFAAVESGAKTFELRRDDRPYSVGDRIELREWVPDDARGASERSGTFTGRMIVRRVTYLLRDAPHFGLASGFVILGLGSDACPS